MEPGLLCALAEVPPGFQACPQPAAKDLRGRAFGLLCPSQAWFEQRFGHLKDRLAGLVICPGARLNISQVGPLLWKMELPPAQGESPAPLARALVEMIASLYGERIQSQKLAIELERAACDARSLSNYLSVFHNQVRGVLERNMEWTLSALTELVKFAALEMETMDARSFPSMVLDFIMSPPFEYHGAALWQYQSSQARWRQLAIQGQAGPLPPRQGPPAGSQEVEQIGPQLLVPLPVGDEAYLVVIANHTPLHEFQENEYSFFRLFALVAASAYKLKKLSYFDNIPDLLYTHDLKGRLTAVNQAGMELIGYPPEEVLGRGLDEFLHPDMKPEFKRQYLEPLLGEGWAQGVGKMVSPEGRVLYMEYRSQLIARQGRQAYVRGSARDVSQRVRARRELARLEEQLRQAQKMEAVGTLAGGVAHDFNNILTGIMGNLALALRRVDPGHPLWNYLSTAHTAAQRAADLTRKLLTFSRKSQPIKAAIDLTQPVEDVVRLLAETMDRRITISAQVAPDLWPVHADLSQLHQLIMNLCVNARDAIVERWEREEGRGAEEGAPDHAIQLSARNLRLDPEAAQAHPQGRAGDFVCLSVRDTGRGMDPDTLERIFEPFFTTKELGKGTGLGLSTVYGIVSQHQGWIKVDSRPGEGAIFQVFLPVLRGQPSPPVPDLSHQALPRGGETILLVDDEKIIRDYGREVLTSQGYQVITAADGRQGLEKFQLHGPDIDLVILDLTMPRLSGREVMARIRAQAPQTRIIISTGFAADSDEAGDCLSQCQALLPKPYGLAELAHTVRRVLEN